MGVITGLVGVGGGFLIVPALVLLGKLPMRVAVGTSLAVISLKSFSGFVKYLDVLDGLDLSVNWGTVAAFIAIGVAGSITGHVLASRINQQVFRRAFAVFLVVMGLFVLGKEAPKVMLVAPPAIGRPSIERYSAPEGVRLDSHFLSACPVVQVCPVVQACLDAQACPDDPAQEDS